ncbi:MAST4 isoform 11, partial [Pongo abelii]
TASLEGQPPKSHFNSARHRQRLVDPAASKKELSLPRRGSLGRSNDCDWVIDKRSERNCFLGKMLL